VVSLILSTDMAVHATVMGNFQVVIHKAKQADIRRASMEGGSARRSTLDPPVKVRVGCIRCISVHASCVSVHASCISVHASCIMRACIMHQRACIMHQRACIMRI